MAERSEVNFVKRVGNVASEAWLLFRLAFDPTTDPIYIEYKRMVREEKVGSIEPQSFAGRLRNSIKKVGNERTGEN